MNAVRHFRSQTVSLARNSYAFLRPLALVLAIITVIIVASGPVRAQDQADSNDRAGLNGVLNAVAAGGAVSARVSLPLQIGFYDGQPALYITPEVGGNFVDPGNAPFLAIAHQLAAKFHANFIPQNFATLPGSPTVDGPAVADIYSFPTFNSQGTVVVGFRQGNVLSERPKPAGPSNTDTNYSPLWRVNVVVFNSGIQPRLFYLGRRHLEGCRQW